jgi:hypothetical protein
MKSTVTMLAVLLFMTTMALAQNSQLPFPQGANPALENGPWVPAAVYTPQNSPSAMAANVGGATVEIAPFAAHQSNKFDTGSPFPTAANPSQGAPIEATFVEERRHEADTGSPFPMAADPSSTN